MYGHARHPTKFACLHKMAYKNLSSFDIAVVCHVGFLDIHIFNCRDGS